MISETSLVELLDKIAFVWIHSIWLVSLIAVVYFVGARILRRPTNRYRLGILALLAIFFSPLIPLMWKSDASSSYQEILSGIQQTYQSDHFLDETTEMPRSTVLLDSIGHQWTWKTVLASSWIIGIVAFSLRFLFAAIQLNYWTKHGRPISSSRAQEPFEAAKKLVGRKKPVRLLTHPSIKVPITFGWLSPVLIVPTSALTGLPPEQLYMIFVHELVHIQKRDFLVCLLQIVVETIFFYHPLVWLISHQTRIDREFACDEEVVYRVENRFVYANALIELEALRSDEACSLATAATDSRLSDRIKVILQPTQPQLSSGEWLAIPAGFSILLMIVGGLWFAGLSTAKESADGEVEEHPRSGPAVWFPSKTMGRERELAEKILRGDDDELKHLAFGTLVQRWIKNDPGEALEFIAEDKHTPQVKQTFYLAAAPLLAKSDPIKILEAIESGQWWPDQFFHVNQAVTRLASVDVDTAVEFYCRLRTKLQRFEGGKSLARRLSERDGPKAGLEFANRIPSRTGKEGAIQGTLQIWVREDEQAAIAYVASLSEASRMSNAICGILAGKGRRKDPEAVLVWSKDLDDDRTRRMMLINLALLWSIERNQAEVNRVLESLPDNDRRLILSELKRMGVN